MIQREFTNKLNYWVLPKIYCKILKDNDSVVLFSILADAENIFKTRWFYQTMQTIESINPALTRKRQEKCIKLLVNKGFIKTKTEGMPKKRHFYIRWENLDVMVASHLEIYNVYQKDITECTKSTLQSVQKVHTEVYKKDINKEHINKEMNKELNKELNIYTVPFNLFWDNYPRKIRKKEAFRVFKKLSESDQQKAIEGIKNLVYSELKYCPHPVTYLNQPERWEKENDLKFNNLEI